MKKEFYSVFYDVLEKRKNTNIKKYTKIKKKFSQITLVVIKYSKDKLGMSKPCLECLKIIKLVGVKNVIYSNQYGIMVNEKVNKMKTKHLSKSQKILKNF